MENTAAVQLTGKQQIWLKHIQTAKAQGKSLSQYARDNDLKLGALYNWKWVLKNEGKLGALTEKPFIKVNKPTETNSNHFSLMPNLQIRFPNQAQVDIQITPAELPQLLAMVKSL
jgi:hypothetical protein